VSMVCLVYFMYCLQAWQSCLQLLRTRQWLLIQRCGMAENGVQQQCSVPASVTNWCIGWVSSFHNPAIDTNVMLCIASNAPQGGLSALVAHTHAPLMASGTTNQVVKVWTEACEVVSARQPQLTACQQCCLMPLLSLAKACNMSIWMCHTEHMPGVGFWSMRLVLRLTSRLLSSDTYC
jgi:hypothetical protein